jgi:hypothetical protein
MPKLGNVYARALITGASSGLGLAFSKALIAEGVEVWGTSRNPEALDRADNLNPVLLDLLEVQDLTDWFLKLDESVGGFDVVGRFSVIGLFPHPISIKGPFRRTFSDRHGRSFQNAETQSRVRSQCIFGCRRYVDSLPIRL